MQRDAPVSERETHTGTETTTEAHRAVAAAGEDPQIWHFAIQLQPGEVYWFLIILSGQQQKSCVFKEKNMTTAHSPVGLFHTELRNVNFNKSWTPFSSQGYLRLSQPSL